MTTSHIPFPMSAHSRPRRRFPRRNRRGLIGILLSIVVAVVVIIGIFAIYNQVTSSVQATQTALFIRQFTPQVVSRYRGNYQGLDATRVIRSGFVPIDWQASKTKIEDPAGSEVTIATANSNASFTMTFVSGVSEKSCEAVLNALRSDRNFEQVSINSRVIAPTARDTSEEISDACVNSGNANFVLTFG